MKTSFFREYLATLIDFVLVLVGAWCVYTILTGARYLKDIGLFSQLLATGAPSVRVSGFFLMLSEGILLMWMALAFVFLQTNWRRMCIGIFFFLMLIRQCLLSPPEVFRDSSALGVMRWFGWLEPVFLLAPYLFLVLMALAALLGFVPSATLRRLESFKIQRVDESSNESRSESLSDARNETRDRSLRRLGRFRRILSVCVVATVVVPMVFARPSDQGRFERASGGSSRGGHNALVAPKVVRFVTQGLTLPVLRNATVSLTAELSAKATSAETILAHMPAVMLSRPMRAELLSGSRGTQPLVLSNWDVAFVQELPQEKGFLTYREDYSAHWLWRGEILIGSLDATFLSLSRSGVNPFFARIRLDQKNKDVTTFQLPDALAFELLQTRIDAFDQSVPSDGVLFIELPPFPSSGAAAQQMFLSRFQELFDRVQSKWKSAGLEQVSLVGLPPENLGRFAFGEREEAAFVIARSTGVFLNWRVGSDPVSTPGSGAGSGGPRAVRPFIEGTTLDERLRLVEDQAAVVPTRLIRNWDASSQTPAEPAAEFRLALQVEWATDERELLSYSELKNFINLTAPPSEVLEEQRVHVLFSEWPQGYSHFQVGDSVTSRDPQDILTLRRSGFVVNSLGGQFVILGRASGRASLP